MSLPADRAKGPDIRGDRRSNVFLAAVLSLAGSTFPVRIRNLSSTGALVDGRDLPDAGDAVRLQRGPYSVVGTIVWRDEHVCGLRFASAVPVQEWITCATGHSGQQRVDAMVASVRAGSALAGDAAEDVKRHSAIDRMQAAEQVQGIADRLEDIAESFAAIPAVVDEGLAALQSLEAAGQKLVDLATRMRVGPR
ncbi:MAG: PilZ domain-containing protein [Sphingomicrobium sp.]